MSSRFAKTSAPSWPRSRRDFSRAPCQWGNARYLRFTNRRSAKFTRPHSASACSTMRWWAHARRISSAGRSTTRLPAGGAWGARRRCAGRSTTRRGTRGSSNSMSRNISIPSHMPSCWRNRATFPRRARGGAMGANRPGLRDGTGLRTSHWRADQPAPREFLSRGSALRSGLRHERKFALIWPAGNEGRVVQQQRCGPWPCPTSIHPEMGWKIQGRKIFEPRRPESSCPKSSCQMV